MPCLKGSSQELKTGLAEKDVESNGHWPPSFDRLKSFDHDDLTVFQILKAS